MEADKAGPTPTRKITYVGGDVALEPGTVEQALEQK